jgi:hypothetical protein
VWTSAAGLARAIAWVASFGFLGLTLGAPDARGEPLGRIQGKVVATDSGEPLGFADVKLIPADTTMRKLGVLTNADGTFMIEAAPGRYTLQITAMSYARKRVENVEIEAGKLLPFDTALVPEALLQDEIVVEGRLRQNTDASLLAARKKAPSVGDAVSAEQVRRSPDKDAAEVLRRVTGLSVSEGKFVFVRGLGERYSSTEVDGVRIASPEQNKRVVPLDLLPANLLDNITVQKTYTSDRPAEFGGGDVQVRTKDFPGQRTWSVSASQGFVDGATSEQRRTYISPQKDVFGFGSTGRGIPSAVDGVTIPLLTTTTRGQLAAMGQSFARNWNTTNEKTVPNASYAATFGDEYKLFGRALGVISSWSYARSFDYQAESQRAYQDRNDTLYSYAVQRWNENVQLGGLGGVSYRLSPRHSIHLRGIYSNSAEDEVRAYQGEDHNNTEAVTGTWLVRDNTRYTYVQRTILSGSLEGKHELPAPFGMNLDWKLGRSAARRQQPDRREVTYDRRYWYEGDTAHWVMQGSARRDYGDLRDDGYGATITAAAPYKLFRLGTGKIQVGVDHQTKARDSFYRRFILYTNRNADLEADPDSVFSPGTFDSSSTTAYVQDVTYNNPAVGLDNYTADQRVAAAFLSIDVPMGRKLRMNLGVRAEDGYQDVRSFALFQPDNILQEGKLQNTDLLPSMNLTWSATEALNLRLAASRTLSRPDLNELSPSPFIEYIGGWQVLGNPYLRRAQLDNYDVRVESFPSLSEVLAVGVFYKYLHEPIEQVLQAGSPMLLVPRNSDHGRNVGVELEARVGLGRALKVLQRFSVNSNASIIRSEVTLAPQISPLGSEVHPLQGQAAYLVNATLNCAVTQAMDMAVMVNSTGRRLKALGVEPQPDIYTQPVTFVDATAIYRVRRMVRLKASARNLLDPNQLILQGDKEVSAFHTGRSFSIELAFGS